MSSTDQQHAALAAMRDYVRARNDWPCCPNCEHFNADSEHCQIAGQRPPARVIANGCEQFEEFIPF